MAENVAITPGSGDVVGADDISSVKYQRVKLIQGADGVNDGDVCATAPLSVDVIAALPAGTNLLGKTSIDQVTANANEVVVKSGAITVDMGTNNDVTVTSGAITADLGTNNDVTVTNDTATNCKVEATIAATQTLATVTSITDTVTVDGTITANAGTNLNTSALATSAAQLADGHNVTIDNASTDEVYVRGGGTAGSAVDGEVVAVQGIASGTAMAVTESTPLSGFATSAKQLADGHGVAATLTAETTKVIGTVNISAAQTVAAVTDITNTVTVDGTVTANPASGTIDTVTSVTAIANSLPAGTALLGKVSIDQATANANEVVIKSGTVTAVTDITNAVTVENTSIDGAGAPTIDSYTQVAINLTTAADQVLVSSAANKQIWVYGYGLSCGDADGQTVSLQDEDDAALTGIMEFAQYGGISVPPSGNFAMPLFKLGTDKDLEIDITNGDVDGFLTYAIVSV